MPSPPDFATIILDRVGDTGEDGTVTTNGSNDAANTEERNWPTPVNKPEFWPLVGSISIGLLIGIVIGVMFL